MKKNFFALTIFASFVVTDLVATSSEVTSYTCVTPLCDPNSDGYIYKGTITLTRVVSGQQETFYLFDKRGTRYVATSKSGPYYRLKSRMKINGIDYKY